MPRSASVGGPETLVFFEGFGRPPCWRSIPSGPSISHAGTIAERREIERLHVTSALVAKLGKKRINGF
jgi:hypothetical protein